MTKMTTMQALEMMARFCTPTIEEVKKNPDKCLAINDWEDTDGAWSCVEAEVFAALERLGPDPIYKEATEEQLAAAEMVGRLPYSLMKKLVKELTKRFQLCNDYWCWK